MLIALVVDPIAPADDLEILFPSLWLLGHDRVSSWVEVDPE